jgi:peptidoglycan LD-endopeptidase LytH
MTRTHLPRSAAFRLAAVPLALAAIVGFTVVSGAATPKDKLEQAKDKAAEIKDSVERARAKYDEIGQRLAVATDEAERAEARLEQITVELQATREQLDATRAKLEQVQGRLNDRAVEAFVQGPASNLEFLLGASNLSDLSDRMEFVDAVATSDADLAQEVRNAENELEGQKAKFEQLQSAARRENAQAQARKDDVLALFQQQQDLVSQIQADLAEAEHVVEKTSKAYKQWLRAQAAQGYGGSHASVPLPAGWEHVLEACPVNGPRSYSDGFGAPRYAGGYHLHKGVDILSPMGTEIVAPFDGVAHSDYNTLGGNVVFVSGKYGTVYNAHLSQFSANSNGAVSAGTVIGYVGDTGDATGIPHDHFEFHPNVMPSSWPASAYGYSIIEDAINPYPLLVAACG